MRNNAVSVISFHIHWSKYLFCELVVQDHARDVGGDADVDQIVDGQDALELERLLMNMEARQRVQIDQMKQPVRKAS